MFPAKTQSSLRKTLCSLCLCGKKTLCFLCWAQSKYLCLCGKHLQVIYFSLLSWLSTKWFLRKFALLVLSVVEVFGHLHSNSLLGQPHFITP